MVDFNQLHLASETARAQARASELFSLYGLPTPAAGFGEPAAAYRRRLLSQAQGLLPSGSPWRSVPLHAQPDTALDSVESQLLDEQVAAFRAPTGPLRSTTEVDDSGRRLRRFYGDPAECWSKLPCCQQPRRITSWSKAGRGADSPAARALASARQAVLRAAGL